MSVIFLKTILKSFSERSLIVSCTHENGEKETVRYEKQKLIFYEYNNSHETVTYTPGTSLNISFADVENNITTHPNFKNATKKLAMILSKLSILKSARPIELDRDSKVLTEIYQLFYDENPDFSDFNIHSKIQTMMSILVQFGISYGNYSFTYREEYKIPVSLVLEQQVNTLFPLGEVSQIDSPVLLSNDAQIIIQSVGEYIRRITQNNEQEEILKTMSNVIYAGRYQLSSACDRKAIAEFSNYSLETVESSIQLVKRIEKRLHKQKCHNL